MQAMTLADHAEAWWRKWGVSVPLDRASDEWQAMYECWVTWAFDPETDYEKDHRR